MSADDLRERLNTLFAVSSTGNTDKVLAIFAEHLTSDATVERAARAMIANRFSVDEPDLEANATSTKVGSVYLMHARAGLAALAAALVAEGEAS